MGPLFAIAIDTIGLGTAIALTHVIVFGIAYLIWSWRPVSRNLITTILDILGVLASLISALILLILLLEGEPDPSTGNFATWFMIFSVVTLGVVPLFTLGCFFLSGRAVSRLMLWNRKRKKAHQFGRPVDTNSQNV